jgi:hypothetical protein
MKTKLTVVIFFAMLAQRAEAILGPGTATPPSDFSGVVAFVGMYKTCSGVLLANDLILTAASCFSEQELHTPISIGYFMGAQDGEINPSDNMSNPVRDITWSRGLDVALVKLTRGLVMGGSRTGFRRSLYPLETSTLPGQTVSCFGYGTTGSPTDFQYVNLLSNRSFVVTGTSGNMVMIDDPHRIALYDLGGPCLVNVGGTTVVAGLMTEPGKNDAWVRSAAELRGWVARARLSYELTPGNTETKIAGVEGPSPVEGAKIVVAPRTGLTHQRWQIKWAGDVDALGQPLYELHVLSTNDCMGVADASLVAGTRVIQWPCGGDIGDPYAIPSASIPDQLWRINYLDSNFSQLMNYNSDLCLDSSGDFAVQAQCNRKSDPQRWRITAIFPSDGETHRLRSGPVCAEPSGSGNSPIKAVACNGNSAQAWSLNLTTGTTHTITNAASMLALDVSGFATGPAPLLQFTPSGAPNQLWRIEWRPGGYAIMPSHTPNMCASTPSLWGATEIWQNSCVGLTPNQLWDLD